MTLITGGAFQGKTSYAMQFSDSVTDGVSCEICDAKTSKILRNYHILVRRLLDSGVDAEVFTKELCIENPECIILIDEIGCGIIPMEKSERIWREAVGICGCILAENAENVIRMVCGIPTAIKGDLL